MTVEAGLKKDLNIAFKALILDNLTTCGLKYARKLFDEMVENTKGEYLKEYLKDKTNLFGYRLLIGDLIGYNIHHKFFEEIQEYCESNKISLA